MRALISVVSGSGLPRSIREWITFDVFVSSLPLTSSPVFLRNQTSTRELSVVFRKYRMQRGECME